RVTQTTISRPHGGSSPQFTRVPFEYSTDNVNYTPLGSGTATGSNWTLTGLNLPTGQNFYIRARGYYGSGYENGSESITESVRNAFIPPPSCVSPPSGMVAWYPGDGNAHDIQDGHDGTLQGGVTFAPGEVEQAFNFGGVDGDVVIGMWFEFPSFTVYMW